MDKTRQKINTETEDMNLLDATDLHRKLHLLTMGSTLLSRTLSSMSHELGHKTASINSEAHSSKNNRMKYQS